jgi:hypothetical protein
MISSKSEKTGPAKIKVSQKTIDDIKRLGMARALKLAGSNRNAAKAGLVAEFEEGVKRMYGANRLNAAKSLASTRAANKKASGNPSSPYGASAAKVKKVSKGPGQR